VFTSVKVNGFTVMISSTVIMARQQVFEQCRKL